MRARAAALALLIASLTAAPARAQDDEPVDVPANAAVVAGPTATGATLVAFDRGTDLCLAVRARNVGISQAECGAPPQLPEEAVDGEAYPRGGERVVRRFGAVPPEVATVEHRFAAPRAPQPGARRDGVVTTTAGEAYRGRAAGQVRFFLADTPTQLPWLTRYTGADGRALHAEAAIFERPLIGRPLDLARGRVGERTWRLRATVRPTLAPTPFERDRLEREVCLGPAPSRGRRGDAACLPRLPLAEDLAAYPQSACGQTGLVLVAAPAVRRAIAVLGDGRRARVPLVDAPAQLALPPARLGAFIARGPIAIRRVEGFDARGRRVQREEVGLAPAAPCRDDGGSFSVFAFASDEPAGPLGLYVADAGVRLCVSLAPLAPRGRTCALPPTTVRESYVDARRTSDGLLIGGAVAAVVAAVEVTVDGQRIRVPTTEDVPGYGGQYRGAVRFVRLSLPATAQVTSVRLLAADGRRLATQPLSEEPVEAGRGPMLLRGPVSVSVVRTRGGTVAGPCLRVSAYDETACSPQIPGLVNVVASCAPRALVVYGAVARSTRRVEVLLDGGRRLRPRLLAAGRARAFATLVPRDAQVLGVRAIGRSVRRGGLRLPPVTRQCGYADLTIVT